MEPVKDFTAQKQEVDCCLDKFQLALDGLVEGSLEDSTQTDAQIQRFWRQYFSLRDRQNGQLQVAVLALAKSGKPEPSGTYLISGVLKIDSCKCLCSPQLSTLRRRHVVLPQTGVLGLVVALDPGSWRTAAKWRSSALSSCLHRPVT